MTPDATARLRILCVADDFPWPATSGYRLRLETIVRALSRLGSVDLWAALGDDRDQGSLRVPEGAHVARSRVIGLKRRSTAARLARWCTSRVPRSQLELCDAGAAHDLMEFARDPYDLVWCSHLRTFRYLTGDVLGPVVLDLDNLWDAALRHRRQARLIRPSPFAGSNTWRAKVAPLADAIDERRYTRLHRRVASRVAAVTVCSELDRVRLGAANGTVIPNAYKTPTPAARLHRPDLAAPRLLMVGLLEYPPNEDAVRYFVESSLPAIRAELPGIRLRLIGRYPPSLADLARVPAVELLGEVANIDPELRRADVVVVPVRYGSGTRVKVLEAFAYRIPVVSTTVGCEGLDVVFGTHLLVADDPERFASACVTAVCDMSVREATTEAAFAQFQACYRTDVVEERVLHAATAAASYAPAPAA